ncbi:MAG: methionyl-tRNA formyltransferase [Sphingomonadales bacterium]
MPPLKLAFMGTPDFALPTLDALLKSDHEIAAVYTQPPRRAGRGQRLRKTPVHTLADAHGLAVRTPGSLKADSDRAAFAALDLDAAVVVAYGLILPVPVLEAPRLGCINVHASLLPRWRGAAPIQRAIMAGDDETGVSIMMIEQGLDSGPVLLTRRVAITGHTTAGTLHDALAVAGATALVEGLDGLAAGRLEPTRQPDQGITVAAKIDKQEAHIDWSRPVAEVDRRIRGLNPFPGAFFEYEGARIQVLRAQPVSEAGAPGEVLDDALTVACGDGAIRILEVKRAGKSAMNTKDMLRGFPIGKGARLD